MSDNVFDLQMLYPESMQDTYIKGAMAQNMDKNFVQRIMRGTPNTALTSPNMDGSRSSHLMRTGDDYMFPSLVNKNGAGLVRNYRGSGEEMKLPNSRIAEWMGMNYKRANPQMFGEQR